MGDIILFHRYKPKILLATNQNLKVETVKTVEAVRTVKTVKAIKAAKQSS